MAVVATAVLLSVGSFAELLLHGGDRVEMIDRDVLEDPEIAIGQLALVIHAAIKRVENAHLR